MHFGVISPPVPGHIHPFGALGRELIARGHRVSFIHMADVEAKVLSERLEFLAIGHTDHPPGCLAESLGQIGRLKGLRALRFTVEAVRKTTVMICRDSPEVVCSAGIDMLLVDQTEPAGGSVAEYLGIPFVTICCALALNREVIVPPPFTAWRHSSAWWAVVRNYAGYAVSGRIMSPVTATLAEYRRKWRLRPHSSPDDSFSQTAQISQQPPAFDFPRRALPGHFHYVGPLRRTGNAPVPFPWERLNGKPLIYASLGTLQHSKTDIFRAFAEACAGLDAQLVLSHCGALDDRAAAALPGDPIAVPWAPQTEVLQRARLALTHAGLNTVLDAMTFGVPLIALPIAYEQPAIAARIEWCGAGRTLQLPKLSVPRLRSLLAHVLEQPSYVHNACRIAESIRAAGGVSRAADIIERVALAPRSHN